MTLRPFIGVSIFFSLVLFCNLCQAQDYETKDLKRLRAHIQTLQADLAQSHREKDTLFTALKRVEQAINHGTQQLVKLDQQLVNQNKHLEALKTKYNHLQADRSHQRKIFARQIRSAYIVSHQRTLKLLLSQQNLASLGRALTYFNYFHHSQSQHIAQISQALKALEKLRVAIQDRQTHLLWLRDQIAQKQKSLKTNYQTQSQVLNQLESEIREKNTKLQTMRENERILEQIVASLDAQLSDIPNIQPFQHLRGNLLWPCQGPIIQSFSTPLAEGEYLSQGIIIAAKEGDSVRAVFHGRVAFANWLRGYGLLLIIDHGDGYMTLYGHNRSLFKEVGDWVDTGEIVAQAGRSGGHQKIGVYFELRYQGKPIDPLSWLIKPA